MTTCEHGTDGCLMAAPHLESECHTYEMMRAEEEAMEHAGTGNDRILDLLVQVKDLINEEDSVNHPFAKQVNVLRVYVNLAIAARKQWSRLI